MEQQLKQQARQVWYIRLMISLYLASTTAYLAYTMGANLAPLMRILLTVVSVVVIDAFNGRLMDASLLGFGGSAKNVQYRQALGIGAFIILTLLAHARFFATTTATYLSRTPMAAAIVGEVQGTAEISAIETAQGERAERTAKLEKEKNRIAGSEAKRIREARRSGQKLIDAAINSQGGNVAALYRKGNGWVMSDRKFKAYRDGIRKAREEAARLESEARMETRAASSAFIASTAQDTAYLSTLNRILENKVTRNEQLTGVYNFTLGFLDIAFGVLYWFLSLFLAQFKRKHDIEYESPFAGVFAKISDRIGDDVLQGTETNALRAYQGVKLPFVILSKFGGFLVSLAYKIMYKVESFIRIDLDGDGVVGTPEKSVTTKTESTDLTTAKVDRMPIGFSVNKTEQKVGETPPTSTDLGTARFADVGVTPTSPTFAPTFEIVGDTKAPEKVGEKSVESAPTFEDKSTDLPKRKTPTIERKSAAPKSVDRANRATDLDKLADRLRAAWKNQYNTYPELLKQAKAAGFTVYTNGKVISIVKPKPTPKRKK